MSAAPNVVQEYNLVVADFNALGTASGINAVTTAYAKLKTDLTALGTAISATPGLTSDNNIPITPDSGGGQLTP